MKSLRKKNRNQTSAPARASTAANDVGTTVSLATLAGIFLRISCTGFGGFMALISVVQNVVVERRKLISQHDMLDGVSLATLLPGPTAVNVIAYVGYRLRGGVGALVSVCAAVLPPFLLIMVLTIAYFQWGSIPAVSSIFNGFIPAVAAIILAATWNMGRKAITGVREGILAVFAAAILLGIGGFLSTLGIIAGAGVIGWWWFRPARERTSDSTARPKTVVSKSRAHQILLDASPLAAISLLPASPALLLKLLGIFSGMSLLLFGGGYVFIPLIGEVVVKEQGWLTQREFIDGVALGQIMPGPILVSAAFIGYKVAGLAGAIVATIGMFGPPALVTVACTRALARMKGSPVVQAVLRGVRPAVVGMIAAAVVIVGKTAVVGWGSVAIFAIAVVALLRFRVEAVWIIPPAGIVGYLIY
jgi:chromate transporter